MNARRNWEESRKTILAETIQREMATLNRYKAAAFDTQRLAIQCSILEFIAVLDHILDYTGIVMNRIGKLTTELNTLEAKHHDEDTRFLMMMAD